MNAADFPIVHFATHGKFSSKAEDTFVLTWDGQINVNELSSLETIDQQNMKPL